MRQCGLRIGGKALDVAAGTLDLALAMSDAVGSSGEVVAVDFCRPMLDIGAKKLARSGKTNVTLVEANAQHMPLPSNAFDAAGIAFGLRNMADVEAVLAEMARVVRPGGRVVCLELAKPRGPIFRQLYNLYFHSMLPLIGGMVNRRRGPYDYLPASVQSFCSREELAALMAKVGLTDIQVHDLTCGVAAVHVGTKI